jgi:hypothetical protein
MDTMTKEMDHDAWCWHLSGFLYIMILSFIALHCIAAHWLEKAWDHGMVTA